MAARIAGLAIAAGQHEGREAMRMLVSREHFGRMNGVTLPSRRRERSGFDGRRAWMEDLSGAITPQDGGDRLALAINEAYRNAHRWWRAHRGGARIAFAVGRARGSEPRSVDLTLRDQLARR